MIVNNQMKMAKEFGLITTGPVVKKDKKTYKISVLLLSLCSLLAFANPLVQAAEYGEDRTPERVEVASPKEQMHQIFKRVEDYQDSLNSMAAAHDNDPKTVPHLRDASAEFQNKQLEYYQRFLNDLIAIDAQSLSDAEQINYKMFKDLLQQKIDGIIIKSYQMPLTSEYGFHSEVAGLARSFGFKKREDYDNYLILLSEVPRFFQQNISNMKAGMARGFTVPQVVLDGYSDGIKVYIADKVEETNWYKPFTKMPSSISKKTQKKLQQRAKKIIQKDVIGSFENYLDFFENEYYPNAKKTIAAYDYPNGKDYYQKQIKRYTTLDLTPKEIHEIGLKEVARIRKEMEQVIKDTKFEGSFSEFLHFLRTDEQFYAKTSLELLKEAAYISKRIDHQLPRFFTKLPRQSYGVVPVPEAIAPKYTTGRYSGAPIHSKRAGEYWVNTYALDKRPLYNLEALTLHEAVPGHHLQTALAQELTHLPKFRQKTYISAFGEGWALYCEWLGLEAGFYQDPYSNFGRLTYEMWRAMRLVVDTGMHAMGMTRDEAIKLMEENTALSTHNVRTEIDRYISWPGQALSYKLGEIKIRKLRAKAEKELGDDFDIRLFHDAILANGSVPLAVLEQQMNNFIIEQKKAKQGTKR